MAKAAAPMSFVSLSSDMLVYWRGTGHVWAVHSIPNRGRIIQNFIRHNNKRVMSGILPPLPARTPAHQLNDQNAVVESTSIVGTIEAINLRNTTR